jgi:dethiobiotin synthetase
VLVVAPAGLGTLNMTELTARELRARGLHLAGIVIGSWPAAPDLAARCNLADLPDVAGAPLLGSVPAGSGGLSPSGFRAAAPHWLAPRLDGSWDAEAFRVREAPGAF